MSILSHTTDEETHYSVTCDLQRERERESVCVCVCVCVCVYLRNPLSVLKNSVKNFRVLSFKPIFSTNSYTHTVVMDTVYYHDNTLKHVSLTSYTSFVRQCSLTVTVVTDLSGSRILSWTCFSTGAVFGAGCPAVASVTRLTACPEFCCFSCRKSCIRSLSNITRAEHTRQTSLKKRVFVTGFNNLSPCSLPVLFVYCPPEHR